MVKVQTGWGVLLLENSLSMTWFNYVIGIVR
jgi:hypothetical protein